MRAKFGLDENVQILFFKNQKIKISLVNDVGNSRDTGRLHYDSQETEMQSRILHISIAHCVGLSQFRYVTVFIFLFVCVVSQKRKGIQNRVMLPFDGVVTVAIDGGNILTLECKVLKYSSFFLFVFNNNFNEKDPRQAVYSKLYLEFQLLFDSTLLRNEIYQSVNALFLAAQQQAQQQANDKTNNNTTSTTTSRVPLSAMRDDLSSSGFHLAVSVVCQIFHFLSHRLTICFLFFV